MTKVTAKGIVGGKATVIICVDDGGDDIVVFKDGKKLKKYEDIRLELSCQSFLNHITAEPGSYNPDPGTIESYWLLLHEIYFDKMPEVTVEGELDTFGSPYSNEDIGDAVF